MSLFFSSCFCFQTDLVLFKIYYNAAIHRVRKFPEKRLWWKPFLGIFKFFKMGLGKGIFLFIFWVSFSGCFQTLNRNVFLWMITLFGANNPEQSRVCQKVEVFSYQMPRNTKIRDFFILSTRKIYVFSDLYSSQKKSLKLERFLCKDVLTEFIKVISFKLMYLVFKFPAWQNFKVKEWHNFTKRE